MLQALSSCRAMSMQGECAHGGLQQRQQTSAAAFQLQRAPVGRIVQQAAAVQLLQHVAAAVALAHCTLRQQVAPPAETLTSSYADDGGTDVTREQDQPFPIPTALHPRVWRRCRFALFTVYRNEVSRLNKVSPLLHVHALRMPEVRLQLARGCAWPPRVHRFGRAALLRGRPQPPRPPAHRT